MEELKNIIRMNSNLGACVVEEIVKDRIWDCVSEIFGDTQLKDG